MCSFSLKFLVCPEWLIVLSFSWFNLNTGARCDLQLNVFMKLTYSRAVGVGHFQCYICWNARAPYLHLNGVGKNGSTPLDCICQYLRVLSHGLCLVAYTHQDARCSEIVLSYRQWNRGYFFLCVWMHKTQNIQPNPILLCTNHSWDSRLWKAF